MRDTVTVFWTLSLRQCPKYVLFMPPLKIQPHIELAFYFQVYSEVFAHYKTRHIQVKTFEPLTFGSYLQKIGG